MHPWVVAYQADLRSKGRKGNSVRGQGYIAQDFMDWLGTLPKFQSSEVSAISLYALTYHDVSDYLKVLKRKVLSGETTENSASHTSTITLSFLRFCRKRFGLQDVVRDLTGLPQGETIDWWIPAPHQIKHFFEVVMEYSPMPEMHFCLFGTMYLLGLRPGEALGFQWEGVDVEGGEIEFLAKGGKWNRMPLIGPLKDSFKDLQKLQGKNTGDVFTTCSGEKMSNRYMHMVFRMFATISGWPHDSFPRVFRHAFCTHLLLETGDYLRVNRLARHSKLNTTERYVHVTQQHYQDAADIIQKTLRLPSSIGGDFDADSCTAAYC
ncbi:tyrosine-type recombinase/integrase [Effusibacillus pohliae]|uniref:tyrosine-type recombinase/integrase n=1 Tax=Effusibacillus pohliae TaxID=232270 RepID=UPI000371AFA0|nr:tyrosine-type recombinase/integrase [Effusibacillus pohliae]